MVVLYNVKLHFHLWNKRALEFLTQCIDKIDVSGHTRFRRRRKLNHDQPWKNERGIPSAIG